MGSGQKRPAKLQGTPWHKVYIKKAENDPKRHKKWCIHFRDGNFCGFGGKCSGSSKCLNYKDGKLEAVKRKLKNNRIPWQAQSTTQIVPNMIQINDTVSLRDVNSREIYELTLNTDLQNAPRLHIACLGKNIDDCVSVNEFTYQIIQIHKTNGTSYTSSSYTPNAATKHLTSPSGISSPKRTASSSTSIAAILVDNYCNNLGILKREQVDVSDYAKWAQIMVALFKQCKKLQEQKHLLFMESQTLPERSEVYSLMSDILHMVGMINGYPIRSTSDLHVLLMAYASKTPSAEEINLAGRRKNKDIFRLRIEGYLARKIIEQQSKSAKILADEHHDLRLIHNLKRNTKKQYQSSILVDNQVNENPTPHPKPPNAVIPPEL